MKTALPILASALLLIGPPTLFARDLVTWEFALALGIVSLVMGVIVWFCQVVGSALHDELRKL